MYVFTANILYNLSLYIAQWVIFLWIAQWDVIFHPPHSDVVLDVNTA